MVATKDVANSLIEDLRKYNFEPTIIGFIAKKERPFVAIEKDINQYVSSNAKLARLNTIAQTKAQPHH
jgi:hypothetical protein